MTFAEKTRDRARREQLPAGELDRFNWVVQSQSGGAPHVVTLDEAGRVVACDCRSHEHRGYCVHQATVELARRQPIHVRQVVLL